MTKSLLLGLIVFVAVVAVRTLGQDPTPVPANETDYASSPFAQRSTQTPAPFSAERREIALTARQWTYEPFRVTAKQGEQLRVTLATDDVPHSFMLPLTPGGEMAHITAEPGQPASTDFEVVQEPGTYYFWCETPCGEGHSEMHGEFVVEGCPDCV